MRNLSNLLAWTGSTWRYLFCYHQIFIFFVGGIYRDWFLFKIYLKSYRVYKKKLNKPEIALWLCKAPQCTKFFIEIGCLGTDNVV